MLAEATIKAAEPREKAYKLTDQRGLRTVRSDEEDATILS
jgi:hypothetical protein